MMVYERPQSANIAA